MRYIHKKNIIPIGLFAVILLITLFFGLKPKGYRFINQVEVHPDDSTLVFSNIGMVYSERKLGEIGITDSMSIVMSIKPYWTSRRMSRIASIINEQNQYLVTIDQWWTDIGVSLWDGNGNRLEWALLKDVLSTDFFQSVTAVIDRYGVTVKSAIYSQPKENRVFQLPRGFLKTGRFILGLSVTGREPWRGEIAELALFNCVVDTSVSSQQHTNRNKSITCETIKKYKPAALFYFEKSDNRTVINHSGNNWNLTIPILPKIFHNEIFNLWPYDEKISKSLLIDMLVNFFGFIPFGGNCFIFLKIWFPLKKVILYTIISSVILSLGIEVWQIFIPTRSSQVLDVILNGAGAVVGILAVHPKNRLCIYYHFLKLIDSMKG